MFTRRLPALGLLVLTFIVLPYGTKDAHTVTLPGTPLPSFSGFHSILFDDAHGLVFVTGGSWMNLLVFAETASPVAELPIEGASGMAQVGSLIYVAAADSDTIDVVDTSLSPPSVIRQLPMPGYGEPDDIVAAAGRLWFSATTLTATGPYGPHVLAGIGYDGSGLAVVPHTGDWDPTPLRTDPSSSTIYVLDGWGPPGLVAVDVSTDDPRTSTVLRHGQNGYDVVDGLTLPDGSLVLASYGSDGLQRMDPAGGALPAMHPSPHAIVGVSNTDDAGDLVATGADGTGPDVVMYPAGSNRPSYRYDLWPGAVPALRGVTLSRDGEHLFVAAFYGGSTDLHLLSLHPGNPGADPVVSVRDTVPDRTPQATSTGISGATVLAVVIGWVVMGSIVGAIARSKGYRFWPWFGWGFFFGVVSLIVILVKRREDTTPPVQRGPLVLPHSAPERPDLRR